ncbi:MAG: M48 family metallopeptidase [Alphaproteobacteria bacterium]|nr:M48 family metallopeptidase [Alphaproteobacteria bacterium]
MRFLIALFVAGCLLAKPTEAAEPPQPTMIRDAEIENTIRAYATPLFVAAGVAPDAVHVHIVVDKTLNAYVADGLNLFLYTGLLTRTENANQLIGVMAHECGHIAGGHLVRRDTDVTAYEIGSMFASLLGAAAMVASRRGDVGSAVAMAGNEAAMKSFFSYTRGQEAAADTAGMKFLDATQQSAKGLLDFFKIIGDQELLVTAQQDPYVRTHPLTQDRIEFVRHHVETSPYSNTPPRPEYAEMHRRLRAKLIAFLDPPVQTLARYKASDPSLEARYARSIAYYRHANLADALPLIDGLIAERPRDPYFYELKGQMLFENGRGREALDAYRQAVHLLPDSPLIRISLGQVLIEQEDPSLLTEAAENLRFATHSEPDNPFAWNQMSIAYGRSGNEGMAEYAMAEYAFLAGKPSEAVYHAGKARTLLPRSSAAALRAQDIRTEAEVQLRQKAGRLGKDRTD